MGSSPDNYTLGKGIVSFNKKVNDVFTGELDLGNCPEFAFNVSIEKLEHYSSRGGLRAKDKEVISQVSPGVSFTLDEISPENLALLTLADIEEVTQDAATVVDEQPGPAYAGKMLALANRNITAVGVVVTTNADIELVEGTDWAIDPTLKDAQIGRIRILDTYTGVAGDMVKVSYTAIETTYTLLKALAQTSIEGFMRFVSDNPVGNQQELQIWRVSLTPSGDTAMIGDDWSTLAFTGEILKDEAGHPTSPYFNIIMS
jgi:hypothetical protein